MNAIGLTGYAGSGKDTAALGLIELGWERLAFADPLKECMLALNPIVTAAPDEHILRKQIEAGVTELTPGYGVTYLRLAQAVEAVGWTEAKKLTEIRRLLQVFGTEVVRDHFGFDTWVNYARAHMLPGIDYVFTDVRFSNEVEMIHRSGGLVVRITRPGVRAVNAHASDDIDNLLTDFTIDNDGTPEALQSALVRLVS